MINIYKLLRRGRPTEGEIVTKLREDARRNGAASKRKQEKHIKTRKAAKAARKANR